MIKDLESVSLCQRLKDALFSFRGPVEKIYLSEYSRDLLYHRDKEVPTLTSKKGKLFFCYGTKEIPMEVYAHGPGEEKIAATGFRISSGVCGGVVR